MKRPLPDGRCDLVLAPTELLRKLAALVLPPRRHLVRFHGVFGPNSSWRAAVVPWPEVSVPLEVPESRNAAGWRRERQGGAATRLPWAELFKRVWRTDVLRCERCGGQMKVLAFVTERPAIRKMLDHLGLPFTGPRSPGPAAPRNSTSLAERSPRQTRGQRSFVVRSKIVGASCAESRCSAASNPVCSSQTKGRKES